MWFKNLYLFNLEQPFPLDTEALHDQLMEKPFSPCLSNQRESSGWFSPFGRKSQNLILANQTNILCRMARQERLLPASVINEEVQIRVEAIEVKEDRKVSGKEKKDLREQVEFEMLPQAFTRTQYLDAWIDTRNQWLIVNTTSANRAEEFTKLMRKTIGSLPLKLPDTESSPASKMTMWLQKDNLPAPFTFGHECVFKSPDQEKSTATFKQHELLGDELRSNLDAGKYVSQLELIWDEKISFVLTEELIIKKLRFLDVLEDSLNEQNPDSHEEKLDIEFTLMTGEVAQMLKQLFKILD